MSNLITHDITLRAEAPLRSWTYLRRFGKGLFSQGIATLTKSRKLRAVFTTRPKNNVKVIVWQTNFSLANTPYNLFPKQWFQFYYSETLSLSVWSLLQVLKKAKRANCVFALTDGTSLEIVSFCGLKIRAVFLLSWAQNRSYIFAIEFQGRAESSYNSFARKCMTIAWQVAGCFSKRKFKRCENIAVWQKMQINNVISFTPTIRSVNTSVN